MWYRKLHRAIIDVHMPHFNDRQIVNDPSPRTKFVCERSIFKVCLKYGYYGV